MFFFCHCTLLICFFLFFSFLNWNEIKIQTPIFITGRLKRNIPKEFKKIRKKCENKRKKKARENEMKIKKKKMWKGETMETAKRKSKRKRENGAEKSWTSWVISDNIMTIHNYSHLIILVLLVVLNEWRLYVRIEQHNLIYSRALNHIL